MSPATDILVRIRADAEGTTTFPVTVEAGDGSAVGEGTLVLDEAALLTSEGGHDPVGYGQLLFGALFAGALGKTVADAMPPPDGDARLRIRLLIESEAPLVHGIRWERLYRERRGEWVPVATVGDTPFSRYRALREDDPLPVSTLPIRILFAIANPADLPGGLAPVDVEAEIAAFRDALAASAASDDVDVTVLPGRTGLATGTPTALKQAGFIVADGPTTIAELVRRLPRSHVVHIVGHGTFRDPGDGGLAQSVLYLEDEAGATSPITADSLVRTFASADVVPALLYFAACRTGVPTRDRVHPFVGLAPRLVDAGVPAVIAMQSDVPMPVAQALSRSFYARLLDHGLVDVALNEARGTVAAATERFEWSIPVLFTRLRQGRLLVARALAQQVISGDLTLAPGATHGALVNRIEATVVPVRRPAPVLLLPRDFDGLIGRTGEVDAALADVAGSGPIAFSGPAGIGKSVILRNLANRAAEGRFSGVVYLPQGSEPLGDLLQFLFDALYEASAALRPGDADIQRYLAACDPVIVLDDADIEPDALTRLTSLVAGGRFVVASRERILWGEGSAVTVPGLAGDDAVALFERALGRGLLDTERQEATAACEALGGHPLHLLQAADRVRTEGWAAVAQAGGGAPSTRPAPASLTAVERDTLAVVAAAGAPIGLGRIEAVVGRPGVDQACIRLDRAGLIRAASPRYVLTEPLPPGDIAELDVAGWRRRLLEHLADWVEQNRNSPEVLRADLGAILAVLDSPAATDAPATALRLARATEGPLIVLKRWDRWAWTLGLEKGLATAVGDQAALGWVRHQQGSRALALGDRDAARAALEEALRIRRGLGDHAGYAVTRHNLELLGPLPTGFDDGPPDEPTKPWWHRPPGLAALGVVVITLVAGAAIVLSRPRVDEPQARLLPAAVFDQPTLDLGTVQVGDRAERALVVTNAGDAALEVGNVTLDPPVPDLGLAGGCTGSLAAGASCTIVVTFSPSAGGDQGSVLRVDDNTLVAHHEIPVRATGATPPGDPGITIDPPVLDFGAVDVGGITRGVVTVTSTGSVDVTIVAVHPPVVPAFAPFEESCTGVTMAPGESCRVVVAFAPATDGEVLDVVTIEDTTPDGTHAIGLVGVGRTSQPDLVVKIEELEPPVLQDGGGWLVTIGGVLGNAGTAEAGPFRITAQAVLDDVQDQPFQVPLVPGEGSGLETDQQWVVHTTGPLAAGDSRSFTARIFVPTLFAGHTAGVSILVDSCAGVEVFEEPAATSCAVVELDEANNASNELRYQLAAIVGDAIGPVSSRSSMEDLRDG